MSTPPDAADLLFNTIGNTGRYQILITLLIFLHRFPVIFHQLMVLLHAPPPGNFTCSDPTLDKCDKNCTSHVFDHSVWEQTIIHQWDLVCDKEYVNNLIQSIVMLGILIGSVLFGFLADRFGRKGPLVTAVVLQLVSGVGAGFSPGTPSGIWCYMFLRLMSTIATGGTMMAPFALLMEFTDKKYRTIMGVLFTLPIHLAHALMGPVGYLMRRWDHIQIALSCFSILMLSYICFLPESPRWLLTMRRQEHAIRVLETAAKCNKLASENVRGEVEKFLAATPIIEGRQGGNCKDLFRTTRMRLKTIVLFLVWMLLSLEFYAVAQYVSHLGDNIFLNITVSGSMQIPANLIACVLTVTIGRKWTIIIAFLLSGVPMAIIIFIPKAYALTISIMACFSMSGAAMAFALIYIYSGELFPTVVRSFGMGLCSMFARFGSMISPHCVSLEKHGNWLPALIFTVVPTVNTIVTLIFLPETKGVPLPDTVEDADKL